MRLRKKKPEKTPVPVKPTQTQGTKPAEARTAAPPAARPNPGGRLANIGKSVRIKGELSGNEDITVDGTVEGKIDLKGHNLTIGPNGNITADVFAKNVLIIGKITGDVTADDRVEVTEGGTVQGDIHAPRVSLADGARFSGKIDMLGGTTKAKGTTAQPAKPTSWQPRETPVVEDDLFDEETERKDHGIVEVPDDQPKVTTEGEPKASKKPSLENMFDPADPSKP